MFVEFSHYGYWPIEYTLEHAKIISDRVKRYKEAGVKSVGINILCTVGHLEEGWDVFPHADLQYMENENGELPQDLKKRNIKLTISRIVKRK